MELSIKERVFPSLRENKNWDWYLSSILKMTNTDLFKYLFQDEFTENINFKVSKYFSESVNVSSIEEGNYLEVVLDDARLLLNNTELTEGPCTYVTYNPVNDVFVYNNTTRVSVGRGTNIWVVNPKTKELVAFFNADTFSPRGNQSSSEDLISEANEHVISFLTLYVNQGYLFVLLGNESSCTQNLRTYLASLGGLQEGLFTEQTSKHLVVGSLRVSINRNLYEELEYSSDRFVVPFNSNGIPYVQTENLVKGVDVFTRASSSKTEADGPEKVAYPEIAELNDSQPYLLVNFVAHTEEGQVVSEGIVHLGTMGIYQPTRFKFGSLNGIKVETYPTMEAAQLQASAVGGRLVAVFNDSNTIRVVSFLGVHLTGDYNPNGKYTSQLISDGRGGHVVNYNTEHVTTIYTCYYKFALRMVDFSPNNFKTLYYKLFGTKLFDLYSYQTLMTALDMLGVLPDSIEFLYEESGLGEGKYNFRDIHFISVHEYRDWETGIS